MGRGRVVVVVVVGWKPLLRLEDLYCGLSLSLFLD